MTALKLIARYNQLSNRSKLVDCIYDKLESTKAYKYFRVRKLIQAEQERVNDQINQIAVSKTISNADFKRINKFWGIC